MRAVWPLVVLALCLIFMLAVNEAKEPEELPPSIHDERLIALDKAALERAYQEQMVHLFAVWLRDQTKQPERFKAGARQARRAYIEAMAGIEQRAVK